VDHTKQRRKVGVGAREEAEAERAQAFQLRRRVEPRLERREASTARLADQMRVRRRGERGERELVHAASSFGER
jgi:hypothetical protein